jgi:hypothetical protein
MADKDTKPLPAVQLADLEGYLRVMHAGAAGRDRPLWAALRDLAAVLAEVVRRLPPG